MRIFVFNGNKGGVSKYRVVDPHVKLSELSTWEVKFGDENALLDSGFSHDVLFVHNSVATNPIIYARVMELSSKTKLIVDVDDHWILKRTNPLWGRFKMDKVPEKITALIRAADLVTTATKYLASKIGSLNPNTHVIPNSIDQNEFQFQHNPTKRDSVVFGMATGSSHFEDIKLLKGFVNKLQSLPVGFALAGFDIGMKMGDKIEQNFDKSLWKRYEEVLLDNYTVVPKEHREFLLKGIPNKPYEGKSNYTRIWTKPIETYGKSYNEFDVALAPLVDDEFNRMKSELKIIEAGFHGIPIVCSDLPMYADVITHGENGFLIEENKSHKDFLKFAKVLMDEPFRTQMGQNLRKTVLERFELSEVTKKRIEIYKTLLND